MNLFFLGANSFIARNFFTYTKENLSDVNYTLFTKSICNNFKSENIKFIEQDFNNLNDDFNISDNSIFLCFLWQTLPNIDNSFDNEKKLNLASYINFFNKINPNKIKKIIFFSSSMVYGNIPKPLQETSITKPNNFYGIGKKMVEDYLINLCNKSNIKLLILRISNPYGPFQYKQGLIAKIINNYYEKETTNIWSNVNEIKRDFLYIDDLNILLHNCINYEGDYKIFNISYGKSYTLKYVLDLISKYINPEINFIKNNVKIGVMNDNCLDNSLAQRELKLSPQISLEDGIRRLIK